MYLNGVVEEANGVGHQRRGVLVGTSGVVEPQEGLQQGQELGVHLVVVRGCVWVCGR